MDGHNPSSNIIRRHAACWALLTVVGLAAAAGAQTFDSGSDGSDGALTLTAPAVVDFFDPATFVPPLDGDGDGVYHFTTITIGAGVTVDMTAIQRGPVTWLASGDVMIDGEVVLDGEDGQPWNSATVRAALPGAGGYAGGAAAVTPVVTEPGNGQGPGGGTAPVNSSNYGGGGGGHAVAGGTSQPTAPGGKAYGNVFLLPLIGGSGGAGGGGGTGFGSGTGTGGSGGSGGGAILIASSTAITVDGIIRAEGGGGGSGDGASGTLGGGGGGSGGAIRLMAPTVTGTGTLSVRGGVDASGITGTRQGGAGSAGRIRIESFGNFFQGVTDPVASYSTPGLVTIPPAEIPVRVTAVDGVAVPADPLGGFTPADVEINDAAAVTIDIEAHGIPLGTTVTVTVFAEGGEIATADSSPLAGTLETSTATASLVVPSGFSRVTVEANWTP